MKAFFAVGIIVIFIITVLFNLYFRWKVLGYFKRLRQANVQLEFSDLLNAKRVEAEIVPLHPEHRDDIMGFVRHIRLSVMMASVLLFLIAAFAGVYLCFE